MHPLLTRGRFGLYLLAWIPLAGILVYVLAAGGRMGWTESATLVLPLCAIYVFVCLSAWYPVKSAPLGVTPIARIALTHVLAAALLSLVWMQLAKGLAYALSRYPDFTKIQEHLSPQLPILFAAGFLLYLLSVAYHYVILSLEASREAEARIMETNVLAREAELKALKAQVNPHFLFNSLNSISALTSVDPKRAREMCILLAEFLRMTLGLGEKSVIPLAEELGLLDRFLAIEKVRFGARLHVEEDIHAESRALLVPPLVLQPLIENAVVHGIANLPEGGAIRMASQAHDGRLFFTIENTFDPDSTPTRRNGMGLANVRRRLEGRYGADASMQVTREAGQFRVQLSLPAEAGESSK
ncbi:MAG TPA: histidine kinase [Candidatus Angelobacter sp.]|nr:histidine kinase [Candidatus Angelobacter sp.]